MRMICLESFSGENKLSYAVGIITCGDTVRHTTPVDWSDNRNCKVQERMKIMMRDDANASEKSSLRDGYEIKFYVWNPL